MDRQSKRGGMDHSTPTQTKLTAINQRTTDMRTDMTMTDIQTPKAARFWNRIAAKYARDPVADQPAYERKLAETAKHKKYTQKFQQYPKTLLPLQPIN